MEDVLDHKEIIYGLLVLAGVFAWHFAREVCSALAIKYWNKLDAEYILKSDFERICSGNRANCLVVKSFEDSLKIIQENQDAMRSALRILIVHTVTDKSLQEEALRELG